MKEKNRNFIGKEGNGKKDGNNCFWVLTRDNYPDFRQIEIVGPDEIRPGRKGSGAGRIEGLGYLRIGEDHNNNNINI